MNSVTDLHIKKTAPLPTPRELLTEIPRSAEQERFVAAARNQIGEVLEDADRRFLVVVGPCSIHDTKAGLEYAERLVDLQERVRDHLLLVMRVYFEKPRTTVGWKGLIMDPHLDGSADIAEGLRRARRFLSQVLSLGMPTATELLDPITPQYIADLICWSAIGARTSESQTHRQMASGLSMPLGFKNTTHGDVKAAVNAIRAATQPQTFLGVNQDGLASAVSTRGNPHCHVILRGGDGVTNYHPGAVKATRELLESNDLPVRIMIDASHANSEKDHNRQPVVFENILELVATGDRSVTGAMLESNLVAGHQTFPKPLGELVFGQSITDACIDWETTEHLLLAATDRLA